MRAKWLLGPVLVAAVVAAYLPALQAGFVWNDDTYLTENRTLDGIEGLRLIWTEPRANEQYYPMVFSSFWVEKRLWSLQPFGYHLVNVLLHAGSALLLWGLLVRLRLPGAWFAAALFALHPLGVESVAWITERKNTLSLLLSLLSIHAWYSYLEAHAKAGERKNERVIERKKKRRAAGTVEPWWRTPTVFHALSLACLTLALFAKTTACVVPAVLLVLVWWRQGRVVPRDVRPLLPLFTIGALLALQTAWLERTMVQAAGKEWEIGMAGRVLLAGQTSLFYAGKLFFPAKLAFIYERWTVDPHDLRQWLGAACVLGLVAAAWLLRRRVGRGPLAGLLLFLGVLVPAMGFFNVYAMRYSWVADHFAYQAVAVFAACIGCGAASAIAPLGIVPRRIAAALALAALGVLALQAHAQSHSYRNEETLWRDTLERSPSCFMCETNYGNWLMEKGRAAEAVPHFEKSLSLRPENVPALLNLARIEEQGGRLDAATGHLRAALRIAPLDTTVLVNLATVSTKSGRIDEAIASYEEALRLGASGSHVAHNGLGAALMQRGRVTEAIEHFREALRLDPGYAYARANLERALSIAGGPAPSPSGR
ncbi:MAG: tetratricopeptide repeat protein [Thermoanaerobaculia bacterium]|nr:tetratricopeptide repeat protein [Thermoanaerobaculia bacterium]